MECKHDEESDGEATDVQSKERIHVLEQGHFHIGLSKRVALQRPGLVHAFYIETVVFVEEQRAKAVLEKRNILELEEVPRCLVVVDEETGE